MNYVYVHTYICSTQVGLNVEKYLFVCFFQILLKNYHTFSKLSYFFKTSLKIGSCQKSTLTQTRFTLQTPGHVIGCFIACNRGFGKKHLVPFPILLPLQSVHVSWCRRGCSELRAYKLCYYHRLYSLLPEQMHCFFPFKLQSNIFW